MADITSFKAVRPTRDKVGLVVSQSYAEYSKERIHQKLTYNPYTFLHILNPGFKYGLEVDGLFRFKLVNNRYREFKENQILFKEEKACYYIYRQQKDGECYTGIIAGTSINDYKNGIIEIHEQTISEREDLFKNYLKLAGFNAEPVLITYEDNQDINQLINSYVSERPEYEFATTNKYQHFLWIVDKQEDIDLLDQSFKNVDHLYIADGHHRSASSVLLGEEMDKGNTSNEKQPHQYFMSYLLAESELKISAFNRLVKDLNGLSKEEFLLKLDEHFRIEKKGKQAYTPSKMHHFSMYLDHEYYSLYLRKDEFMTDHPVEELDPFILNKLVLEPILGIKDPKKDKRIGYASENQGTETITTEVDEGHYEVAFMLYPVSIEQVKKVADAGEIMPPKSTFIEPKIRSGLLVYEILEN